MNFKASFAVQSPGAAHLLCPGKARQVQQLLRVMRITAILLLVGCLHTAARTHSQTVTLSAKNISLEKAFYEIKKQTGFNVLYTHELVSDAAPVTIEAKNLPLKDFLHLLLNDRPLTYAIENTTIAIEKKKMPPVLPPLGDDRLVSGIVIDEDGNAVGGATVTLRRTKRSVVTDAEGRFSLNIKVGDILIISFVGYEAQETVITSSMFNYGDINFTLFKSVSKLDEVQIMGYGTTTRRLGTGTISSVKADVIEKQPVGNVIGSMDGRMAGVEVIQPNGLPGAGFAVKVRGDNTLGVNFGFSSSDPLYVIDGVPQITGYRSYDTRLSIGVYGMNGGTNLLSNINPKDILQIDVLKDADATAIYGARGANGVVLITTKKGQQGKVKLNVDLNAGGGKIGHFIPVLNTQQYLELRKEAFQNEGLTPNANNAPDLVTWDQNIDNDFQRMLFGGTAKQSNANVNISGGSENIKYYAGLNYRKEGTVMNGDNFVQRIGGLINLDVTSIDRKFNALFSVNYSNEKSDIPSVLFPSLLFMPPNYSPVNADGTYNWNVNFTNPIASLLSRYQAVSTLFNSSMTLSYKPVQGLTLKVMSSYSINRTENSAQHPAASSNPFFGPQVASAVFAQSPTASYTVEPQAVYEFKVNGSEFTALAGGTISSALSESTILSGTNYSYESQLNTISAAGNVSASYLYNKYNYASGFARLTYDLRHKYLLNLNYRKDASSRFGPNNKLAGFASVGAAWIFSAESGIKESLPFLTFGKLKMSYGSTGNDRVDNYLYELYYTPYNTSYFSPVYQGVSTLGPGWSGNPGLAWEITRKAEISLDLGFLKDRILFRANVYRNRSSNIINAQILPSQSGNTFITSNVDALVQNTGTEIELTTKNIQKRDFGWSTSFNISFERNRLLRFNNIENTDASSRYVVGAPINVFVDYYKYDYAGPDPATGLPVYKDFDGNPGADKYVVALGTPYYGGLTNTITFKNFTLDIFIKFQNRRGKLNDVLTRGPFGSIRNQNISALSRYTPGKDNESVIWPLAVTGSGPLSSSYNNFYSSDFAYGNIAYMKLKNLNLSYDVPREWIGKAGIQNLRLYFQCQNLFVLAKQKYVMDPELPGAYPSLRAFVFGINCSL